VPKVRGQWVAEKDPVGRFVRKTRLVLPWKSGPGRSGVRPWATGKHPPAGSKVPRASASVPTGWRTSAERRSQCRALLRGSIVTDMVKPRKLKGNFISFFRRRARKVLLQTKDILGSEVNFCHFSAAKSWQILPKSGKSWQKHGKMWQKMGVFRGLFY